MLPPQKEEDSNGAPRAKPVIVLVRDRGHLRGAPWRMDIDAYKEFIMRWGYVEGSEE